MEKILFIGNSITEGRTGISYVKSLKRLKSQVESQIFITTLSCIGENLESKLNLRRQDLNEIIVRIADEIKINVIDIGKAFNEILKNKKTSGYLLGENVSITLIDTIKVRNNEKASLELS